MRMSKKKKTALMPRLRFPGFNKKWQIKSFDETFDFHQTNTFTRSEMNTEKGKVKNIHYGDILTKYDSVINEPSVIPYINEDVDLTKFRESSYLQNGDIIIADTAEDLTAGKAVEIQNVNCNILAGLHTMLCRPQNTTAPKFFGYYLNSPVYHNSIIPLITGTKVSSISKSNITKTIIITPEFFEQQKIADCLSSLDELIAAEEKKLEALKMHKKGLMQGLFPPPPPPNHQIVKGRTVPERRFPEFRDSRAWEEKNFGDLCKFTRGPFGGTLKKEIFVKNGYAVYEQHHAIYNNFNSFRYFITEKTYNEMNRFSVHADDIIMSCSGTMGKFAIVPKESKEGIINQALLKLTINNGINVKFAKTTLELKTNQEKLLSQSAGGAIKNVVSVDQMKEIKFLIPHFSEQEKIADCLDSLDRLIITQSEKIETLKVHKKGLMQALFPSMRGGK
jgi:type I restriction enzyme S subunit